MCLSGFLDGKTNRRPAHCIFRREHRNYIHNPVRNGSLCPMSSAGSLLLASPVLLTSCFEVCGRYLLSVEALRRWADSETDRSLQLHELRVSCWLDLTRSAARWREPAAACLAGHNYAALASYTPAVYSTPSMYSNLAGFELNSMKVAPYTDCARTCKSPSLQLGS